MGKPKNCSSHVCAPFGVVEHGLYLIAQVRGRIGGWVIFQGAPEVLCGRFFPHPRPFSRREKGVVFFR